MASQSFFHPCLVDDSGHAAVCCHIFITLQFCWYSLLHSTTPPEKHRTIRLVWKTWPHTLCREGRIPKVKALLILRGEVLDGPWGHWLTSACNILSRGQSAGDSPPAAPEQTQQRNLRPAAAFHPDTRTSAKKSVKILMLYISLIFGSSSMILFRLPASMVEIILL